MYVEIDADWIYNNLREDLRENLDYDGIETLLEYYEELECCDREPMKYDISLFWCWDRGTLEDIYLEHNSEDDLKELREQCTDDCGEVDYNELEEEVKSSLEYGGVLLPIRGTDEYLYNLI